MLVGRILLIMQIILKLRSCYLYKICHNISSRLGNSDGRAWEEILVSYYNLGVQIPQPLCNLQPGTSHLTATPFGPPPLDSICHPCAHFLPA